jgi:uncharacterized membrane protein YdjX (TVP38/TMEM64 family)
VTEQTSSGTEGFCVRPRWSALVAFVTVPLVLVTLFHYAQVDNWFMSSSSVDWIALEQEYGVATNLVFLAIFAVFAAFGLPRVYPAVLAGSLLGIVTAMVLALTGATLGAVISFHVARKLGQQRSIEHADLRWADWSRRIARNGFQLVLLLRLLPGMNSLVTTGLAGMTGIRASSFSVATLIGIVPSTAAYVLLGDSLSTGMTWRVGLSVAMLITLVAGSFIVRRRPVRG